MAHGAVLFGSMTDCSERLRPTFSANRTTNAVSSFLAGNTSHGRMIDTFLRISSLFSQVRTQPEPLKNKDSSSEKVKKQL
jgi:hypothetical protein